MSASFFKRLTSSIVDFVLIFLVVYFAFVVGGRTLLRNRVDNFDEIYSAYNEILVAYNSNLTDLQTEYDANLELANEDAELEALALTEFNQKSNILNQQNNIDIEPYNEPLTSYYLEIIYFFTVGFIVLMTIVTIAFIGRTPGRKLMKVQLASDVGNGELKRPNPIQVFFHDIILKYFFIVLIFAMSMYYGLIFILVSLIIDMVLISVTKNKSTIRDYLLRLRVVKAGNGY